MNAPAPPPDAARLLVITPTFNERDNLAAFVSALLDAQPQAHLLVVDDASPDGTGDEADRLAARDPRIHCLHRAGKLGLGTAYVEGFSWALERGYDLIAQMDADLSHDPRDLERMLATLRSPGPESVGLVLGARNIAGGGVVGWGVGRHVLSKGGSAYARLLLGLPIRDMTTGFKVWTREALCAIEPRTLRSNGYAFQIETTHRAVLAGVKVVEKPILFVDRRVGHSKMSSGIFGEAVWGVWRLRFSSWTRGGSK